MKMRKDLTSTKEKLQVKNQRLEELRKRNAQLKEMASAQEQRVSDCNDRVVSLTDQINKSRQKQIDLESENLQRRTENEAAVEKKEEIGQIMQHLDQVRVVVDQVLNGEACEQFLELSIADMNNEKNKKDKQKKTQSRSVGAEVSKAIQSYVDQAFEKYDTDKNGRLSFEEIKVFLMDIARNKLGLDQDDAELFLQFEKIDLDGSGDIDK